MQALERFESEKGFRLATYATWWITSAIQEFILRSWLLVKIGTATNQRKLFFNLRKAKNRISVLDEGDVRPDQVKLLAKRLGVTEHSVIDMNRRLGGDASLNAPIGEDGDGRERQDWLADDLPSQERILVTSEELKKSAPGAHPGPIGPQRSRAPDLRSAAPGRRPDPARSARERIRRFGRAGAPDRDACLRESAKSRPTLCRRN